MILNSKFDIRDNVRIDDDESVRGVIVAIRWSRDDHPHYEISWMHNGAAEFVYFDEWRLSK
jgi:hypothetical protein